MEDLLNQAIEGMKKRSAKEISDQIDVYIQKITTLQEKLKIITENNNLTAFTKIYKQGDNFSQSEASATQILENDSKAVMKNKVTLDAYHVLSEIGAWFGSREQTQYSVTVTGNLKGVQQKVSWNELTFEQFAGMVDFSGTGPYGYSSKKVVLKQSQDLLDSFGDTAEIWGERETFYKDFEVKAKALISDGEGKILTWKNKNGKEVSHLDKIEGRLTKWANVRQGNILEAFLRYEQLKQEYPQHSEERLIYLAMNATMVAPAPFYKGGDVGNIQIKGDYATVVRYNTVKTMLDKTRTQLEILQSQLSNINKNSAEYTQSLNISKSVYKSIEDKIKELAKEFVDTVNRGI